MRFSRSLSWLVLVALAAGAPAVAEAHGMAGKRFFPATLAIEDPFVADELSFPTFSIIKTPKSGEEPATRETELSVEFAKRLSPDLGLALGGAFLILDPDGESTITGFDNLEVGLKYVLFKSDAREALLSVGLDWDVGGTGSRRVDAESFSTLTPALYFGKGLGDLPDALEWLKPVAVTGTFGVAFPTRARNAADGERNPTVAAWGLSLQYNLQYLQSFVRDVGLPQPFSRMIPLVEFALQTPLDTRDSGRTTGTVNPGILWFGRYVQLGLEAVIPVNERTGKNIGVLGQIHFYLDDIAPAIFSWTPFHGVLGPTQPR
jgi:hypothetical protein